ncbi:MAG: prephenate dehydrogenase/arogenate dehydrogenase family protein [Thermoguttaceae bacterium]|jgi:prephenate dehydrogenase|nr:prephenate dehydrogenase/arogenate dehydrogenase family protein [Thermoguttaceae bacterium]
MKLLRNVAIVGVGLIGGSIGLALRERKLAETVVGIGRRQGSLRIARRSGAVTNTTIDIAKGVAEAELVILCSPVGLIVEHARIAAQHAPEGTLITDAGSTKQSIVEALDTGLPRGCRFLGGHPLAGSEKSGPSYAQADLFEGRAAILTPTLNTHAHDYDLLEAFWQALGAVVVKMPADEHDRTLAMISHLPHLAASMLAAVMPEPYLRLGGTGLRDTTRLAAGSPELWQQIMATNREHILSALEKFGRKLAEFHTALRDGKYERLGELLTEGKKNRDALGS